MLTVAETPDRGKPGYWLQMSCSVQHLPPYVTQICNRGCIVVDFSQSLTDFDTRPIDWVDTEKTGDLHSFTGPPDRWCWGAIIADTDRGRSARFAGIEGSLHLGNIREYSKRVLGVESRVDSVRHIFWFLG